MGWKWRNCLLLLHGKHITEGVEILIGVRLVDNPRQGNAENMNNSSHFLDTPLEGNCVPDARLSLWRIRFKSTTDAFSVPNAIGSNIYQGML